LGSDQIRRLLPHSWPFLFVDRVGELEPGVGGTGIKNVSVSEPYFAGHFPHESIMPGVLIIEALAQLAGVVVAAAAEQTEGGPETGRAYLAGVRRMRFRQPVRPGDQLELKVKKTGGVAGISEFKGEVKVGPTTVADGSLIIAV
jgi:3-hydroxyacyl-[acyl-carrier-protein] dehydratase